MDADPFAEIDTRIAEADPAQRAALTVALAARLARLGAAGLVPQASGEDENISVKKAAGQLAVSMGYVYRNADELPFTRRIGRRLVVSKAGLDAYMRKRR